MAELPNTPTITALTMMCVAFVAVFAVVIPMYIQYSKRKRNAALMIAVSFTFWGFAAMATFIGAVLHYINAPIAGDIQFSRYGINLGYAFSALSNIFMVLFVSEIFSRFPVFRRTKKTIPIINGILNGVTIGLIVNAFVESAKATDPTEYLNPAYPIPQTVYHLILTFISFTFLLVFSARARNQATLRWEKAGFGFIIWTSITGICVYLSFVLDLVVQDIWPAVFGSGYTQFNNLGWLFAIAMVNLAYIGFFMPNWIRERYKAMEEN